MKKHIPNLITSLNLVSGFIAVIFALNGNIITASWLILAAMVFDFCDGFSSRALKAYSDIGKELDSLSDMVSFGVAPAIIIYQMISISMTLNAHMIFNSESFNGYGIILLLPVIMPVCGALRLAKFNTDETQTTSFKGLPIPANALAVISIVIAWHYSPSKILASFMYSPVAIIIFTFIISLLMVTRLPLLSLKTPHLRFKGNEGRYLMIFLVAVTLAIFGIGAAPLIIPLYIIASLISLAIK
ncbi:MAG: CDP-diacylglycerol--serine O-phosphatidyltransferase [Bacteroidales bacterium]